MRILILHNTYQQAGGEDSVVRNECAMLEGAGHEVVLEQVGNNVIQSFRDKIEAFVRVGYNPARVGWMENLLDRWKPDIVHIHNFFPLLTFAVHETARRRGVAVVQTLHNYRLGCAGATFERDGVTCEQCLGTSGLSALRYRCYRGSLPGSAAVVMMQHRALRDSFLARNVDVFIALTKFSRDKFVEIGIPADKIALKPNFIDRPDRPDPRAKREGALFVGRLSKEKGVMDLIEAWKGLPSVPLTVIGVGPCQAEMEAAASANVTFLGKVDNDRVQQEMRRANALVMPSIWYEGFPVTLVEAFANGLPALVNKIGSLAEIVSDGENGLHCKLGDPVSLRETGRRLFETAGLPQKLSAGARKSFEGRFSMPANLTLLLEVYELARLRAQMRPMVRANCPPSAPMVQI